MPNSGTGSRLCAAVAVTLIVMPAFGSAALAQQAQTPRPSWRGTLVASVHSVVLGVTTTMEDTMNIVLEYDGRGNLTGSLVGNRSFNVQDHPDCNWAITIPNKLRGKLVGSYTPGTEAMSIQLVEPVVAPAPKKDCPGGGYIHSGGSLHEDADFKRVLGSPRAAPDGTFRSSFAQTTGPVTYSLSLTLRGTDCLDNLPGRGFVFYTGPGGAHSDPSIDSPIVGRPPVGWRLMFTGSTRSLSGERWFRVALPGAATWPQVEQPAPMWVPANAVSCVRPVPPPQPKPKRVNPSGIPLAPTRSTHAPAARG